VKQGVVNGEVVSVVDAGEVVLVAVLDEGSAISKKVSGRMLGKGIGDLHKVHETVERHESCKTPN
jgi:hypothetical protein